MMDFSGLGSDSLSRPSIETGHQLSLPPNPRVSTPLHSHFLISGVQAHNIAVRQYRTPVGLYVRIESDDTKWKTTNKPAPIHPGTIEWDVNILLPSDPASRVRFIVFASFEFAPMLGNGEVLCTSDMSVAELLDYSQLDQPIPFAPGHEGVEKSCSAILVKVDCLAGDIATDAFVSQDCDKSDWLGDRALTQIADQGHDALCLYHRHNKREDLQHGVELFQHALDLCPKNHPCRAAALVNLAVALLLIDQPDGTPAAFDVPISSFREALDLRGTGHPDRAATLLHLALALVSRFEKLGVNSDADEAQEIAFHVQDICSTGSYEYRRADSILQRCARNEGAEDQSMVMRITTALSERYERFGDMSALHELISLFEGALRVTPNDHPSHTFLSIVAGTSLFTRFQRLGDPADLNRSLSIMEEAVRGAPEDSSTRSTLLDTLGSILRARFMRIGDLADLNRSIAVAEETVRITPDSHPDKHMHLNNYGASLATRFQRHGNLSDISLSIQVMKDAVRVVPNGDPDRPKYLSNLGDLLRIRFGRLDNLADLDQSVMMSEEAVNVAHRGYSDRAALLRNLGISLLMRYQRLSSLPDLEKSIQVMEEAVQLLPEGHPDQPAALTTLSLSLLRRFERCGEVASLNKSVSVADEAVQLTPRDHPSRFGRLSNLGNSLHARFVHSDSTADLERAILVMEEALPLTPEGHPDMQMVLGILGSSLSKRFHQVGDLAALDRAVSVLDHAVRVTPEGHANRPLTLNVLGNSLRSRFERLGDTVDLDKSVEAYEAALRSTLDGHPERPVFLSNLGISLHERFERHRALLDINSSIVALEKSVDILPDGHPGRPRQLIQLANSLCSRFEELGDLGDLDKSISISEEALHLLPDGHPFRRKSLTTLGRSLLTRTQRLHNLADLTRLLVVMGEAERLTPEGHPEKPMMLSNFGESIMTLAVQLQTPDILQVAISYFSRAASSSVGAPFFRFHAARRWIQCSGILNDESLLDAHSHAISLLPQLAWIGLSLEERYNTLMAAADVARDAASTALACGKTELAVEWLEEGRSVVWAQLFQLRTPNDELRSSYPNLADQFERLSNELERASARGSRNKSDGLDVPSEEHFGEESLEKEAQRHRALAMEREKLLEQIRGLPGFERFLLPKTFCQLWASAHLGPVVLLNASRSRCDALAVVAGLEKPVHIPLPDITYEHGEYLQSLLDKLLANGGRVIDSDDAETRGAKIHRPDFAYILSELWGKVVKPVLCALEFTTPGKMSRIFWCPCGPFAFLPLHAAGDYSVLKPGNSVSDFVVSSYTPTLSVLSQSPGGNITATTRSASVRLLAVPQPSSDGQTTLYGARTEVEHIKTLISSLPSSPVTLLQSSGTVEEVMSMMRDSDWVHFACHGLQDSERPANSGLCLADGRRLKLSDIIQLSRPRSSCGLAFLSACQTATGDRTLSEEAVHLSAGMLFAAYSSVIGTMWSIPDSVAPHLARHVYGQLFKDGVAPDSREAAQALHDATRRLRQDKVPFIAWVPFIHLGL